jgi:hypothetical protein
LGAAFLAGLASLLAPAAKIHYLYALAGVVGYLALCVGLGMTWLVLWARRTESRLGQFTTGSFFFLAAFVAIFASTVQWFSNLVGLPLGTAALFVIPLLCLALRFVIPMTESILWGAVWLVRRRRVQKLLAALRSRGR